MSNSSPTPFCDAHCLALLRRTAPRCIVSCLVALERNGEALSTRDRIHAADCEQEKSPDSVVDYPRANLKWEAKFLQKAKHRLTRLKQAFARSTDDDRERAGFLLAAHLALIFIPAASFFGLWHSAASEATTFLHQISSSKSSTARSIGYLTTLAVPVMWALIFAHPDVQGEDRP